MKCSSGGDAGGRDNQYPGGKVSGGFTVCDENGYIFYAAVTSHNLSVEYISAVDFVILSPPQACDRGIFFI